MGLTCVIRGVGRTVQRLQAEVASIQQRENDMQVKYSNLMLERAALLKEFESQAL